MSQLMTVSALLQICDNWFENLDNWKFLGEVVFLVIRKAFNSVDHSILLEKVEFMESDRKLMWFESYL